MFFSDGEIVFLGGSYLWVVDRIKTFKGTILGFKQHWATFFPINDTKRWLIRKIDTRSIRKQSLVDLTAHINNSYWLKPKGCNVKNLSWNSLWMKSEDTDSRIFTSTPTKKLSLCRSWWSARWRRHQVLLLKYLHFHMWSRFSMLIKMLLRRRLT